ncbi:hypothetical protein BN971_02317 [Mycobacterium numidiamassiliense]|jgi:hypothetical protein|uniref:Cytochrome n=1 Tax=Mycobacterium numidiamassiliense TaxID=1841861 RepID=A0A2U3P8A6_9MYCO|nr:DUF4193 domain-containing protein [Mycobacterium numidiamassiliense]SPM39970.1 hypothetical protein BN971_02317 [Mycobacterium numidiamassiliense]
MATATDYDARRAPDPEVSDPSVIRELASNLPSATAAVTDEDPSEVIFFEAPDADLSGEELSVTVIPQRSDEFTCSSCFLVQHRSRMRTTGSGLAVCADCA